MTDKAQEIETLPSIEKERNSSLCIVTATYYPSWYEGELTTVSSDKIRGDLALELLMKAKEKGYQISLSDGSNTEFRKALDDLGIKYIQEQGATAGDARRDALAKTAQLSGVKVVCETEPEKVSIVTDCLDEAYAKVADREADIVVPKRDQESFSTYPAYQAREEQTSNELYNRILRKHGLLKNAQDIDFWIGVRVFANRPEVVDLFERKYEYTKAERRIDQIIEPDTYSNPLFFPVVEALHRGLRVESVNVRYVHPKIQTDFEEGKPEFERKRDIQRRAITTELVHFIKHLESKESRLAREV